MFIEIFNGIELFTRIVVDFDNKTLFIKNPPNENIKRLTNIFSYVGKGFVFDFDTVSTFLKNRGITSETEEGVYKNIDDKIKIVVLRD